MQFSEMTLDERVKKALKEMNLQTLTEIQEKSIPPAMAGHDIMSQSMTGSGKTAAFAIPILHKVERGKGIQALVLAPTRELALQITEHSKKIAKYTNINICTVYGGVSIEPQISAVRHSEIVIGTPGRVLY